MSEQFTGEGISTADKHGKVCSTSVIKDVPTCNIPTCHSGRLPPPHMAGPPPRDTSPNTQDLIPWDFLFQEVTRGRDPCDHLCITMSVTSLGTLEQKVAGSIPGQGTCLGCGFGSLSGTHERQQTLVSLAHRCFSPSLPPSPPLSLNINK